LTPHPDEVSELRFVSLDTLREMITKEDEWAADARMIIQKYVLSENPL